uniref:ZMYM2-like/QRICH1 C-terminal domain-containing protein n=1 Tax=Myripristis murdjan TaxID=586833 RepID=A0A668AW89_9TELE
MDNFIINFDLFGGLTFDEWLKEEDRTEQKMERYKPVTNEELDQLEKSRNEASTARSTSWAVKCFQDYLSNTGQRVDFSTVSREDMNKILREFYGAVRNSQGQHYAIGSYIGLRAGINRYMNDPPLSQAWCLMQDTEFTSSNNVLSGLIKTLRRAGHDKSQHHPAITEEDIKILRNSAAMNPKTPQGLVNKVWFDIQLHFGRRGKEGLRRLTPQSFIIKRDAAGAKYVSLAFNEETKNHKSHQERDLQSRRGAMFEELGSEFCPVSSFEKYLSKLPKEAKAFYLHPRRAAKFEDEVWYSLEPMGVNYLGSMLSRICKEAGTSVIYTNHCIRISGHKSESSLHSYWAPSLTSRKRWSSVLCENVQPLEERSSNISAPPAKRQTPGMGFMDSYFSNCSFNGSIQFNFYSKESDMPQ